ncbi:hypothetical protein CPC08DRAFT_767407 [Agrocybe pediades]|nr:hypothetical protein CPC08DRAFT_767407 [Agrocybe pediades]
MTDSTFVPVEHTVGVQAILAGFRALGIAASVYQSAIVQEAAKQPEPVNVTLSQLVEALETVNIRVISPYDQMIHEDNIAQGHGQQQLHNVGQNVLSDLIGGLAVDTTGSTSTATTEISSVSDAPDTGDPTPSPASTSRATAANTISGFVCAKCDSYNLLRPSSESWYTVIAGRTPGVYKNWAVVYPLVTGVSKACFKKHKSEEEAREVFAEAVAAGVVRAIA